MPDVTAYVSPPRARRPTPASRPTPPGDRWLNDLAAQSAPALRSKASTLIGLREPVVQGTPAIILPAKRSPVALARLVACEARRPVAG